MKQMKRYWKRILSILLTLAMLPTVLLLAIACGEKDPPDLSQDGDDPVPGDDIDPTQGDNMNVEPDPLPPADDRIPIDVTPVQKPYVSPGLGDNMDALHWTIWFGHLQTYDEELKENYEQAMTHIQMLYNLTNGAHQMPFALGNDVGRFGTAPELIPDDAYPMGDGTPGSGYERFEQYTLDAMRYNASISQILEPALEGATRNDYLNATKAIDERDKDDYRINPDEYGLNAGGNKTVSWGNAQYPWYDISMVNRFETGREQETWERNMDNWNYRMHVYLDALEPIAYHMRNESTKDGGLLTTSDQELDACIYLTDYIWENYALSSSQEFANPKWRGHSCYFTFGDLAKGGKFTDDEILDYWGNGVMISGRNDDIMGLVWGTEYNGVFAVNQDTDMSTFIYRYFLFNAQYLYMLEQEPLSYINNDEIYSVTFTNNLVTKYDRKTGVFTMTQGDFVLADGTDRFVPQIGAGCKIYAYSHHGSTREWVLPETWDGIEEVDLYQLSLEGSPVKLTTIAVNDGKVKLTLEAGVPYLVVPTGNAPTPTTVHFDENDGGETLKKDYGIRWSDGFKLRAANADGGFGSTHLHVNSTDTEKIANITLPAGSILHSFKVGNIGGSGTIIVRSSNPANEPVIMTLPETGHIFKLHTNWKYAETGTLYLELVNDQGVSNIVMDHIVYTEPTQQASISIFAPSAAVSFMNSEEMTVTYASSHLNDAKVTLLISDDGKNWKTLVEDAPNNGTIRATIPADIVGERCIVRIQAGDVIGESGSFVVIDRSSLPREVMVNAPKAATTCHVGEMISVAWTADCCLPDEETKIELSIDGKTWTLLADGLENSGEAKVMLPEDATTSSAQLRITVKDVVGVSETFTIKEQRNYQTLFEDDIDISGMDFGNDSQYELGVVFAADVDGTIPTIRIFTGAKESGEHTVRIWDMTTGECIAGPYKWNVQGGETGWKVFDLPEAVEIKANTKYMLAVSTSSDQQYVRRLNDLVQDTKVGHLSYFANSGMYTTTLGTMPNAAYQGSNYYRDIHFVPAS